MKKHYSQLNWLQKFLIKCWFKHHSLHLAGLKAINVIDVINLWNDELLFSFYNNPNTLDRYIALIEKHHENYIIYDNVIFLL